LKAQRRTRAAELSQQRDNSAFGLFPPEETLLTARQTCKVLSVSRRTLYYWSAGQRPMLSSVRIGRSRRWVLADIQKLIAAGKIGA
jgi:predicted DNA-binding transcriptional regulator AlpA